MDTPLSQSTFYKHDLRQNHRNRSSTCPFTFFFYVNISNTWNPSKSEFSVKRACQNYNSAHCTDAPNAPEKRNMMAHLQTWPSYPSVQQTPISLTYKPQRPPLSKMGQDIAHYHLFLAQVPTYKLESFYYGVHNWTRTTQTNKQLSITISVGMLALLPRSVSPMFLDDTRFTS